MWTDQLIAHAKQPWQAAHAHPFVLALGSHRLERDCFRYFVRQDAVYLLDFSRVLAMGAVRSEARSDERLFLAHAETVHVVEASLHQDLAPRLGIAPDELAKTPPGLITVAYTDHLMRTAWTEPLPVLVAALLPCYVLYREVGLVLRKETPSQPVPEYAEWIETYSGEPYGRAVEEMTTLANRLGSQLTPSIAARAARAHWRSVRYEWLFWQQAWTKGNPLGLSELEEEPTPMGDASFISTP